VNHPDLQPRLNPRLSEMNKSYGIFIAIPASILGFYENHPAKNFPTRVKFSILLQSGL
jgi:hypothetical protein